MCIDSMTYKESLSRVGNGFIRCGFGTYRYQSRFYSPLIIKETTFSYRSHRPYFARFS